MPCKRGNEAARNKYGHCLCIPCKSFRARNDHLKKEYRLNWQRRNKEKCSKYSKKWNDNNREKRRAIEESWKRRNPDKVRESSRKAGKKWAKNNKGKRNAIDMRRKAGLIKRTPIWADLSKIKFFYIEAERLTKETGVAHEVDHIIPLQGRYISGLHVHNNLQILTRSKNRSKGNKTTILC